MKNVSKGIAISSRRQEVIAKRPYAFDERDPVLLAQVRKGLESARAELDEYSKHSRIPWLRREQL